MIFHSRPLLDENKRSPVRCYVTLSVYLFIVAFCGLLASGPFSILVLLSAVAPGAIIYLVMKAANRELLPTALSLEFILYGGFISTSLAFLFEMLGQITALDIWKCEAGLNPSWQCNVLFVLVVIVSIGLCEESAKAIGLARLHSEFDNIPHVSLAWHRYVADPLTYVLCGVCSAIGFATNENLKYVISSETTDLALMTAGLRAVVAVPFHVFCTTIVSSRLALDIYNPRESPLNQESLISHEGRRYLNFAPVCSALLISSILHGVYDSGLFLSEQFSRRPDFTKMMQDLTSAVSVLFTLLAYIGAVVAVIVESRKVWHLRKRLQNEQSV